MKVKSLVAFLGVASVLMLAPQKATAGGGVQDTQSYYLLGPGFETQEVKRVPVKDQPDKFKVQTKLKFFSFVHTPKNKPTMERYGFFDESEFAGVEKVTLRAPLPDGWTREVKVTGCSRFFGAKAQFQQCTVVSPAYNVKGESKVAVNLCAKVAPVPDPLQKSEIGRVAQLSAVNVIVVRGRWVTRPYGEVPYDQAHYVSGAGENVISLACDGTSEHQPPTWDGAVSKCVHWGYPNVADPKDEPAPDPTSPDPVDPALDPQQKRFLACIRMARADYCGDGISHTRLGTAISFYDGDGGSKALDCSSGLCAEAAWGFNGAHEIFHVRWNGSRLIEPVPGFPQYIRSQPFKGLEECVPKFKSAWKVAEPTLLMAKLHETIHTGSHGYYGAAKLTCLNPDSAEECDKVDWEADDTKLPDYLLRSRTRLNDAFAPDLSLPCSSKEPDPVCEGAGLVAGK